MPPGDEPVRVLVVEDEASYREALASGLAREGFAVEFAADGREALDRFAADPPDIVLLDLLLPGLPGTEVCRRMRELAPVPIVMVSAVDSELDVVLGLELGATDYVTKPYRMRELVARIQAVLRRVAPADGRPDGGRPGGGGRGTGGARTGRAASRLLTFGSATVDPARREVTVAGAPVHLSRREFDLLTLLLSPAGQVRTRDELIERLWPDRDLSDSRTLDTHIHRLRAKLEGDPDAAAAIVTVRGVGFRLDPGPRRPASAPPA